MIIVGLIKDLFSTGAGKAGLFMLLVLLMASVYSLIALPRDFGANQWSSPAAWENNPKNVPPVWVKLFGDGNHVSHITYATDFPTETEESLAGKIITYHLPFNLQSTRSPEFLVVSLEHLTYHGRPPIVEFGIVRPDGSAITLHRYSVSGPRADEKAPIHRFHEEPLRISLTGPQTQALLREFYFETYGTDVAIDVIRLDRSAALLSRPDQEGKLALMSGEFKISVTVKSFDVQDSLAKVGFVLGGTVYGLMGTDSLGRDLAKGLLFGLPIALFIGISVSLITSLVGTFLGILSGYAGNKTDIVIQRVADITANVPLLPLLIFLVFIFGSKLFLIILFLIAFSWPGLTILIRSMVIQLRSGQLVETATVLGASKWRVMRRYLFPHTAPFVFAQMIFLTPAAILAEAGLSFLGLGDPSLPTWGQILESGFRTGAVFLGWWWWIIPPGILIVITAITFMLLALAMEPVVNPRLKRLTPVGNHYSRGKVSRVET